MSFEKNIFLLLCTEFTHWAVVVKIKILSTRLERTEANVSYAREDDMCCSTTAVVFLIFRH